MVNETYDTTSNVRKLHLGGGGLLRFFGILFFVMAGLLIWYRTVDSLQSILTWAMWSGFAWHMMFLDHHIKIDLRKGTLTRQITSLYPVYRLRANLHTISGFSVARSLRSRDSHGGKLHELVMLFDTGERVKLMSGGQTKLIDQGKKIAEMCDKPLVVDGQ
ncbi:hypothetical protein K6Q96_23765 [Grimontia kaedaensis]|uniref:DUF304 domain-containing protein n=1 Tax=Grimontia kaedaensis TaxID=2872157 RepID=A0ABY4X0F9_9GAMM|nr:hypothetical protein [Grimontia kaedaensis]USH04733.1 hypothetical protein K6Q96_23765 [Grimontia kaedaensis]